MNRLSGARSPYLLQHANNPVDWWPWCDDAFAEARRRDVPVLISVGYSACHWCHVMAHESFEDESIAAIVNRTVVPIKVDREERPDVDAVYMAATQLMSGQGGWPMTVFATPQGQPFHCGTYFPPQVFTRLVLAVDDAWRDRGDQVRAQGLAVVEAIGRYLSTSSRGSAGADGTTSNGTTSNGTTAGGMTDAVLDAVARSLYAEFDPEYGGFGTAPKFPPHMNLLFLLRHHQRTGDVQAIEVVRATCAAMASGGMYDQLAGGFARYSVDRTWTVPHFEKMLYDNALLLRVYTALWRLTGDALAKRVAGETATFLATALRSPDGGLCSALDADTDGEEGETYVWTPAQLLAVLGDEDGAWAADQFGVVSEGTFEHGTSVLRRMSEPSDAGRFAAVRAALAEHRATRPQPGRDDKIVAAWNGLAITALVEYAATADGAGAAGECAVQAGRLLASVHMVDGRLRRVSRDGLVGDPAGVLEDYGCVAEAFCALHQYTGDGSWLGLAGELLDVALARFDDGAGGFFDTADDAEALVSRPADRTDTATPSGTSALAAALITYSALTGERRYREAAERALGSVAGLASTHGRFAGYAGAAAEALHAGPVEVAVASPAGRDDPLAAAAWSNLPPGAVVVAGLPDAPGVPLLAGRPLRGGAPAAYVCRGFVCAAPVTTEADLVRTLGAARAGSGYVS
jgi:uncharacterized protein